MKYLIVILALFYAMPTQAVDNPIFYLTGMANVDGICTHGRINFQWQADGVTDDGGGVDWVGVALKDAQNTPLDVWVAAIPVGTTGGSINTNVYPILQFGLDNGALNDLIARPVYATFYDTGDLSSASDKAALYDAVSAGRVLGQESVDPGSLIPGCVDLPVEAVSSADVPTLNGDIGMADIAVFNGTGAMQETLDIYEINGVTGEYAFTITQEMLNGADTSNGDSALYVAESGMIELWALEDGRYMIHSYDGNGGVTDLFFEDLSGAMDGYSYNLYTE